MLARSVLALAGLAVLLAVLPRVDPAACRAAAHAVSSVLWLLLLGGCWALLAGGSFYLLFVTFALTHDELVRAHQGPGPRPRRPELFLLLGWLAAILAGWSLLPEWAPMAVHAGCLALALLALALPGGPDATLLWRRRGRPAVLRAASWRIHMLAGTAVAAFLLLDSVLFFRAVEIRGGGGQGLTATLPVTANLASLFAWTGAAALLAWSHLVLRTVLAARFLDPALPCPVAVHLAGPLSPEEARRARGWMEDAGFRVRTGRGPSARTEVPVRLVEGPTGRAPGGVNVSRADPGSAEAVRRIARRDQIQARRLLVRGLERLFRRAAARTFERGHGFWVAPWHWFCVGLSRDEDERALDWEEGTFFLETVGPAYHRVLPRTALHHAHGVMRDLEVDLVFVEDGVAFRSFRRVLRMCFEVHDMLGSRGRAEERHFTGIPGVRVVIHDYTMEEPFRARRPGYPEPDYETVGRARILHVFRDRQESEATEDAPREREGAPLTA
jgi:hypothetical protein